MSECWGEGLGGPLAGDAAGFAAELGRLGYSRSAAKKQRRMLANLSIWLDDEGLAVDDVVIGRVEPFFEARREAGVANLRTRRVLAPLIDYLRRADRLGEVQPLAVDSPVGMLVGRYRVYLSRERGLVEGTVAGYLRVARALLGERLTEVGFDLEGLTAGQVIDFAARFCSHLGLSATRQTISALRCLLRYLVLEGLADVALDGAVLAVAGGSERLPRAMSPADVGAILAGCDRRRPIGRRDYAILMLLARLGLRGGEVVTLCLADVDWRAGEIVVTGKGRRSDRLPLPVDVGEALAAYLRRGRPRSEDRRIFLRAQAPFCALTDTGALRRIMAGACQRAGVAYGSPHRLRHSAATGMLRAGGSLFEIGQVLRHASPQATAVYAAVDHEALRALAPAWPEAGR
jgi:integrase/recombinase XerD